MNLFYINFLFYEHKRKSIVLCFFFLTKILIVVPYVLSFSQIVLIYHSHSPLFSSILKGVKKKVIFWSEILV